MFSAIRLTVNPVMSRCCSTNAATSKPNVTFANLLRNCKFTQMGDPQGKVRRRSPNIGNSGNSNHALGILTFQVFVGQIYHTANDDLYIDFGGKFPAICKRPQHQSQAYVRGAEVRVMLKKMEMSQMFLGFEKELSLLEADAVLLGLHKPEQSLISRDQQDKSSTFSADGLFDESDDAPKSNFAAAFAEAQKKAGGGGESEAPSQQRSNFSASFEEAKKQADAGKSEKPE